MIHLLKRTMPLGLLSIILIISSAATAADPAVKARIDAMLKQMTPEEKISLLAGIHDFYTRGVERVGLPEFKMTDGPVGTRNDGPSTAYPADVVLAATWDPAIAHREGIALGRDAKSRGDRIVLGPGTNIYRVPQNGRNFEYMGEDPFLAGQMDAAYIQGMQSQGVAACVKHFACNNQETNRMEVNAVVDERTLQEIYLPAFEAAVKQGKSKLIMCSYNRLNGSYASANHYLLTDVLRKQWGFEGLVVSDWGAVHETLGCLTSGLDIEMPGPSFLSPAKIQPLIDGGQVSMESVDEKVRHLLRVGIEMGWLNSPAKDASIARDDAENDATALAVAREGIVLLKNDQSLLPLSKSKTRSLVVMGIGGDRYVAGGGSSYTQPARPVTILQGLTAVAPNVKITNIHSFNWHEDDLGKLAKESVYEPKKDGKRGLNAMFFNNPKLEGEPAVERTDTAVDFDWSNKLPMKGITTHSFSGRWTGTMKPATSGKYVFVVRSDDGSRVKLDGKTIIDMWQDQQAKSSSTTLQLEAGETHELTVEYYNATNDALVQFAYFPLPPAGLTDEQHAALAAADAAIVCVRTSDSEGSDRGYNLSTEQEQFIHEAAAANPHTIVILESGGNVAMKGWIDTVPVLVDAWFPGQAGGRAIAEILFGDVNPSGHLPVTLEKDFADSPAYGNYPGKSDVNYAEGIYVGYRWFDSKKIEPRFPFGFGLSYTSFGFNNVKIADGKQAGIRTVAVDVTNTGKFAGATVVQLYVRPPANELVDRPTQELKGFAHVDLKPGETRTVSMSLDARSFSHWDVASHSWQVTPGEYEIAIGQSSRDITVTTQIRY